MDEYEEENLKIVEEYNWIGDKILDKIPSKNIFRGYNPDLSSGSDRLFSLVNDANFRKKNEITLIDTYDSNISKPIGLGTFPLSIDYIPSYGPEDPSGKKYGRNTKEFADYGNWRFNPRFQIYNDKSTEVFRGFYQHYGDIFSDKDSKLFYQCDLIVPVGNVTLGTKYISPVKNKKLLSELSKVVNTIDDIFI